MVGLVFGDLWPGIIFILSFIYSTIIAEAHQRDDQDRQQGQQACMVSPNVTALISFFLTEGNKKNIDSQGEISFSATARRNFEIFKKAVLNFRGM